MAGVGALGGGIGQIGSGIGDIFGGIGQLASAGAYKKAAKYAGQNAVISKEAGDIKLSQAGRLIFKTIGAQEAGYAGAGLASSGSAQDVLRSSVSQGALEKAIIGEQTQIDVNGYLSQQAQFKGMATAAKAAGIGGIIGGIAGIFSDRRLKTDIEKIGMHGDLGLYNFRFIGDDRLRIGVMADEVAIFAPHALGPVIGGFATVNYELLGLDYLLKAEA